MPDLPLVIGPDANRHIGSLGDADAGGAAARPQIAGATWVGQRRWDIRFQSGELLTLPEGDDEARRAIARFAMMDQQDPLLGRGFARIDMRDPAADLCPHLARARRDRARRAPAPDPGQRAARPGEDRSDGATRSPRTPVRNLVTALDVGSSKVCALIAEPDEDGKLRILGTGQRESRGVKRGFIADMEKSETAIREAVEQAERIAGTNIDQVFVGFSAGGLVSNVAGVEVAIGGRRITAEDIDALARRRPGVDRSRGPHHPPRHAGALHDRRRRRASSSRAASMPTRSRSTSTSSPPIRRR